MTNPHPHSRTDLEEIAARNETARRMIAGFSAEMPALAEFWRHLDTALAGNLTLCAEVARLNAELAAARLEGQTCSPPSAPRSPPTPMVSTTPCTTSGTSWTPARRPPSGTGGHHDQLPANAPAIPAGATRGHAAHDGHQPR